MKYIELPPLPALRAYVHLIWCLEFDTATEFGPPERIAPDGIVEFVFHYRGKMAVRFAGEGFAPLPRSSIVCQTRRYVEMFAPGTVGFVSVRFRPWGALHFLGAPVSELADQVVAAEDVWGGIVGELEEQLSGAAALNERVALVEQFLLGRLCQHRKNQVETAVRAVWRHKGDIRVVGLCRELGISERTAQRVFRTAVGMSPKSYARLARFLHACSVLRRPGLSSLTEAGYECGYYDQAHFIGDFKAYSGMTPGEFVAARAFSFLTIE
jgi:AraC-like DNA-binding protein